MSEMEELTREIRRLTDVLTRHCGDAPDDPRDRITLEDLAAAEKVWKYFDSKMKLHGNIVLHCWPGPGPAPIEPYFFMIIRLLRDLLGRDGDGPEGPLV